MTHSIYRLDRSHLAAIHAHFDALGDDETRLRFGSFRDTLLRHAYVDSIPFERDSVFGVYANDLTLVGIAHLACLDGTSELGLSVLGAYQGRGIATALFNRAIVRARNLNIRKLTMHCLPHNSAMMHIAHTAGMKVVTADGGTNAYLELPPGNLFTFEQDATEQGLAAFDWVVKASLESQRQFMELIR